MPFYFSNLILQFARYQRLSVIKEVEPWAFTIGGAFFENKFPGSFNEQINVVCDYFE